MAPESERPDGAPEPETPAARAEALSRATTALREAEPEPVPQRALVDPKIEIRYFVSYSRKKNNPRLALDLLERLQARFQSCPEYRFVRWIDREDIEPGDRWKKEIEKAIDECHFGLLLVSPYLLASEFITKNELPHFVAEEGGSIEPRKRAVPVGLQRIPFDGSLDLKGLSEHQVFRDKDEKFYGERAGKKEDFVDELFQRIRQVVQKRLAAPQLPRPETDPEDDPLIRLEVLQDLALQKFSGFVPTKGRRAGLEKSVDPGEGPVVSGEQVDAVDFLTEWAADPIAPAFCALLGDSGMGKTTTCEAFSRRLLEQRKAKPELPVPIYLDLRHLGDAAKSNPFLDEILLIVGSRSISTGRSAKESPRPDELMDLVQSGKAIAIFDGLDEVLVHLTPAQGQRFTRELWRISPPRFLPAKGKAYAERPRGKVLISCRTHYFRSLREEQAHFLGEDREKIAASDYRALVLLPFTTQQIEEYLEKNLPGQDIEKLLELIRSIHNLEEMAERPYTLKLIAEHIPKLEQWRLEGRTVTGVTLYREMVASWLERDAGKHTLTKDHKLRLMERFAAELWISGKRMWSAEDVEQWLLEFLAANPQIKLHYEKEKDELLKEDLRTATFLVRDGEDGFRFAHTSLQEFFLAAHLYRALREQRFEAWQLPVPSPETLDFLGQLIAEKDERVALGAFRGLREEYRPQASELMLAYAIRAKEKAFPSPSLFGIQLNGARLKDWTITAPEGAPRLDLKNASFRGANLQGAKLYRIDLSDADFQSANLTCAELIGGVVKRGRFGQAVLVGTVFRDLNLSGSSFEGARLHRTQWLRCVLEEVSGLANGKANYFAECKPGGWNTRLEHAQARLEPLEGHSGWVRCCAWSADGKRIASVGDDGTVRIWDAETGEASLVLEGHRGWVLSCAWSTDGKHLASSGQDGTVRTWDAETGRASLVLEGHGGWVLSCAWSGDGKRLAATGQNGAVWVWDAKSGEAFLVLEGHRGIVRACAWSREGERLASAGDDGSVRIWDVETGVLSVLLECHRDVVRSCMWSMDGKFLASAGDDGTVRVWDTDAREETLVLQGHRASVLCCAWSADGKHLASCGVDGTVLVWEIEATEDPRVFSGHRGVVRSCAWSMNGEFLASAGDDGSVRVWNSETAEIYLVLEGHRDFVLSCAWSLDGKYLASAGPKGTVRIWDADTGKALSFLGGHRGYILSCAWSADGNRLASAEEDGNVRIWDAATGEASLVLSGHRDTVRACVWSADGKRLASAGDDGTVRVWEAATGEEALVIEGHQGGVNSCVFSPDGESLASAGDDGTVRVWEAATGKQISVFEVEDDEINSCAFSSDGRRLACAGNEGIVRVWETATGEASLVLEAHWNRIFSCVFSPDGKRLASAGNDGIVRVWDAVTGEAFLVLEGHRNYVYSCPYSPDGKHVASAGIDGTVRVWDAESGREIGRIEMLPNGESASFFGPALALTYASPGAWRYLGWLAPDPETGVITRYPAEIFGPLPGPDADGGWRKG